MMKRLVWMGTGYVAGATSSWWVQRKVRRTAERVLPGAVRREVAVRAGETAGRVADSARRLRAQVMPEAQLDVDLRDLWDNRANTDIATDRVSSSQARARLRERARRARM